MTSGAAETLDWLDKQSVIEVATDLRWVTARSGGKWSHRLAHTRRPNPAIYGEGGRPWYLTLCGTTMSTKRDRPSFVTEHRPKPECPLCARKAARAS